MKVGITGVWLRKKYVRRVQRTLGSEVRDSLQKIPNSVFIAVTHCLREMVGGDTQHGIGGTNRYNADKMTFKKVLMLFCELQ